MEIIKKLAKDCVAYCKDNLVLTAILGGSLLIVLITVLALICKAAKNKKARKRLAKVQAEKAATPAKPVPEVVKQSETPVQEKQEVKEEPAPVVTATETAKEEPVKETAPVAEIKKEPVKEVTPVAEIKEEPVKEATPVAESKEEPAKEEVAISAETKEEVVIVKEEKEETPKKTTPTKKKATSAAKKTVEKPVQKQESSLIDELNDAPEGIDFYEESETDKQARYKGKWTICRVVTEENSEDDEEMYFFELHASNGEKLLSSEEYTSYAGAVRGIQTHKNNIAKDNFKVTLSKKGDYIFKLLSGKNMLLCMGENYPTKARCESAIESTKRFAETAVLDENVQDHVVKIPVEDDEVEPLPDGYNGKWIVSDTKNNDGEQVYYFELFANNGEKLLSSEEYTTYIGAINGIETHKNNISKGNFRISLTKRGDYIYKILNGNGQLLCLGEHYKTKRRCLNAVESVKRFAANSPMLVSPYLTK